jgi:hypothetical protein
LFCTSPGQRLRHISGISSAAENNKYGNQEQDKNYENNDEVIVLLIFRGFFHTTRVSTIA